MEQTGTNLVINEDGTVAEPLPGDHLWDVAPIPAHVSVAEPFDFMGWVKRHRWAILIGFEVVFFSCWVMVVIAAIILG